MNETRYKLIRPNMGHMDQSIRLVCGSLLVAIALIESNAWFWLGLYPLLTGLAGSSPLYRLLGIESHRFGY